MHQLWVEGDVMNREYRTWSNQNLNNDKNILTNYPSGFQQRVIEPFNSLSQ